MIDYHTHKILTFFAAIPLSFLLMSNGNANTPDASKPRSIQVSGTGKASGAPDKADLTLSVEVQAKTAETARNQAANAMDALIKTVKNAGVADKDIQTRSVSLYPVYSPDAANKITGYQLANQVVICIREIEKSSDIIDSAVKAGGNATRVQGISFGIDKPEAILAEARDKAFTNAKIKAEQYAKLAGVSLGSALYITEGIETLPTPVPYAEMRMMKAAAADSASTPVQAGEQELSVDVNVIFAIQ